jgi:hypothetical protein
LTPKDLAHIVELLDAGGVRSAIDDDAYTDYPSRLVARVSVRKPLLALKLLRWPRFSRSPGSPVANDCYGDPDLQRGGDNC